MYDILLGIGLGVGVVGAVIVVPLVPRACLEVWRLVRRTFRGK
jgi:hypothetical protein